MTKQMPSKKLIIIICTAVIAVVAAVVAFIAPRASGEESYRSIMVYELQGDAVIERADIGTIDAAENLYLESGDRVRVREDSMMRLKLDNDKYITAEENTVFVLTAEGDEQDSKTRIDLEQGAVTNEIQNPLGENSTYETITPNAVMAVRGTVYRAELCEDEEGNSVTKLYCFKGAVEMGAFSEKDLYIPVIVEAGKEASVNSADRTVSEVTPIDYENLPPQVIEILNGMNIKTDAASGTAAGAEEDSKQAQTAETSQAVDADDTEPVIAEGDAVSSGKKRNAAAGQSSTGKKDSAENTDTADRKETAGTQSGGAAPQTNAGSDNNSAEQSTDNGNSDNSGNNGNSGSSVNNGNSENNSGAGDSGQEKDPGKEPEKEPGKESETKPDKPEEPETKEYTVTFLYNGMTFATQKVKAGEKAAAPVLRPAQNGGWDFDFGTEIKADTTISWK